MAAQLLQSPKLDAAQLQGVQIFIARQVKHISFLLDDLLDVSRISRGSFLLKKEQVDVRSLIEEAIEAVTPAIDAKRHTLRGEIPQESLLLEVDPARIITKSGAATQR